MYNDFIIFMRNKHPFAQLTEDAESLTAIGHRVFVLGNCLHVIDFKNFKSFPSHANCREKSN